MALNQHCNVLRIIHRHFVILKVVTGQSADDVAALAAEIDAEKAKAAAACEKVEWLERERTTADSFTQARSLDEQIAELRWTIGKADERIPHLEGQLRAARAERQAAALVRHQALLRRRYSKFRHALQEAVEQKTAVIKERQAAVAELGEQAVQLHLPNLCYAGFLFEDFFALWTAEQDGVFAEPLPNPAVVAPRPAPAPAKPAEPDFGWGWTRRQPGDEPVAASDPPPRPKPVPRRDAPPADGSQRQVVLLRTGLEFPDGSHAPARAASSMRLVPVHRHRRG
jgi:hypothetical protein